MPVVGQVSAIPSDVGIDLEWKIDDFASLSDVNGSLLYSPDFNWKCQDYFLKMYPNGRTMEDSLGYIDIYFFRRERASDSTTFDMFVSIKAANGEKVMERHVTSAMSQNFGYYYLFRRFISRSELMRRKSELLPSGVLTILITLKKQLADRRESNTAKPQAECSYCKEKSDPESILMHQKKCMRRPIKCPACCSDVVLQDWLDGHECLDEKTEGGACVSVTPTCPLHDKLLQDFKQLFDNKENTDAILNVQDVEFHAHRAILIARSPVFAANFRHEMRENASGVIDIADCDSSCFSDFLCYLYCGEVINKFSHKNVFHLFKVADKYEVLDLRSKCLEYLKNNIKVESFCDTISLAFGHFENDLINLATNFFIQNAEEILVTVQWQKFVAENPTQSNELFLKYVKSAKSSKP